MITRINIEGYKSIKSMDLALGPINILLGANGVGKSNFVSVFSLVKNIHRQNFQNFVLSKGGADGLLHFGKKKTQLIKLEIEFTNSDSNKNRFYIELGVIQNTLFINTLKTAFLSKSTWHYKEFDSNTMETVFADVAFSQAHYVNQRLREFEVYHFHDTSDTSPMKGISNINDNFRLKPDASNLAAYLYLLKIKHPKHFQRIEKMVQTIAPFFERFILEPDRLNTNNIQLEWREKGQPEGYFNAYHLSDGTLRFICLATLLMQPEPPATIIIDEPELGLHPVAINKLAAMVRAASEKSQIILSTQSVNLLDNFSPEDIIVTNRTTEGSTFERLHDEDFTEWLQEYTLGDLWGQNKFGAQPYSV
jgi:predicted ATPase